MGSQAINAHEKKPFVKSAWVWYESNAALNEGEAVCYNQDYGTATAFDGRRLNRVETPSITNAQYFAGVASKAYSAKSTGQFIEIYLPGSVCNIWFNAPATSTINVGFYTFDVTSSYEGFFRYQGLPGVGSAIPLQTIDRSTAGLCMAKLMEGPESGGVQVVPLVDNTALTGVMVGGSTYCTGLALANGDCTLTLADATSHGLLKKFYIVTTEITTNDFVITISNGVTDDIDDVSLDTCTFAGASTCLATQATFKWGGAWILDGKTKDVPVLGGS